MNIDELTIGQARELAKFIGNDAPSGRRSGACGPVSGRAVIVADRGWIFAGDMSVTADGYLRLDNAVHVFRWEGIGFAKAIEEWKSSKVDIRPVAPVELPMDAILFRIPVAAERDHRARPEPVVVPGGPGQPEPPAAEPIGPADAMAVAPNHALNDEELNRIAAMAPGQPNAQPTGPDSASAIGADRQALLGDQIATAQREGAVQEQSAAEQEKATWRQQIDHAAQLSQQQADLDELQGHIKAAEAAHAQAVLEHKQAIKDNFQGYWANKSTGSKVLAAISVALGAFGAGLADWGKK